MWHDPHFYILLSFILFVGAAGVPLYRKLKAHLQIRQDTIQHQLDEVEDLYTDAKKLMTHRKDLLKETKGAVKTHEKALHDKLQTLEKNHQDKLSNLESSLSQQHLNNKKSLEKSIHDALARELMERVTKNVHWLIEHKVTDTMHQKIIDDAIAEIPTRP